LVKQNPARQSKTPWNNYGKTKFRTLRFALLGHWMSFHDSAVQFQFSEIFVTKVHLYFDFSCSTVFVFELFSKIVFELFK